jgi:hypothetical protein
MRTLFLALVTSATVFVTGVTEVAASDYRYCIQGENFGSGIVASPATSNAKPQRQAARPTAERIFGSRMSSQ